MCMPTISAVRLPAFASVLCVLFAAGLAGCATQNPLIDPPVAAAKAPAAAPAPAATPPTAAAAASTPVQTARAEPAKPTAATQTGVQTVKERRFLGFFTPYVPDIHQGNFVSREMVTQLKPGMTPDQVRFVLGTPLLIDMFHADRWDYVFRLKKGNGEVIGSRVTVFFKDNRLARFEGGDLPSEEDYLSRLSGAAPLPK